MSGENLQELPTSPKEKTIEATISVQTEKSDARPSS